MKVLQQIIAITLLNLRNLPQRIGSSLVAVIGVAAVVLVFAAVLSMARGFERTMLSAGTESTAQRRDVGDEQQFRQRPGRHRRKRAGRLP
jgi:putative ABC transport system permease protein